MRRFFAGTVMSMPLHIVLKVAGAIGAGLVLFIVLRLFGVKPLDVLRHTGQTADAAASDIRDLAAGKRHEALAKEISKKDLPANTKPAASDKPLTEDEEMQRELAAERERFLKARRDALNETREKVLRGELEDHKRKREKSARGTGEQ